MVRRGSGQYRLTLGLPPKGPLLVVGQVVEHQRVQHGTDLRATRPADDGGAGQGVTDGASTRMLECQQSEAGALRGDGRAGDVPKQPSRFAPRRHRMEPRRTAALVAHGVRDA